MTIPVEYAHDELAHERGERCEGCKAAIAALPAFQPICPACSGTEFKFDTCGIYLEWMTCQACGWRKHGQSGRAEVGRVWSPYAWRRW